MHAEALRRRIRVVAVTTRVAARSLSSDPAQADQAVRRGLVLLDGIEADVGPDSGELRATLTELRNEFESLLLPD